MGVRELGPWVGDTKPHGKTPCRGNPSRDMTYLFTFGHVDFFTNNANIVDVLEDIHIGTF